MVKISGGADTSQWDRIQDTCTYPADNIEDIFRILNEVKALWVAKATNSGIPPGDKLQGIMLGNGVQSKLFRMMVNSGTNTYSIDYNTGSDSTETWSQLASLTTAGVLTLTTPLDHGVLSGRNDDDHTLYTLADGTRAFTGVQIGIAPTQNLHLTTRNLYHLV